MSHLQKKRKPKIDPNTGLADTLQPAELSEDQIEGKILCLVTMLGGSERYRYTARAHRIGRELWYSTW